MQAFRIKFLIEELLEYCEAVGFEVQINKDAWGQVDIQQIRGEVRSVIRQEDAFDSLVDLCYVALGTAYLHRFPFNEGWDRVQAANMQKIRA